MEDTRGSSKLAEQLFQFPFIKGLFVAANFITVTKTDMVEWNDVMLELRQFIKDYLTDNDEVITETPLAKEEATTKAEDHTEVPAQTKVEQQIIDLLEEYVRPAVESDGGAIHFKSYDEGTVFWHGNLKQFVQDLWEGHTVNSRCLLQGKCYSNQ